MCLRGQVYQKSLLTILDIHLGDLLTPLLSSLLFTQLPVLPPFSPLPSSCAQTRCRRCAGVGWQSAKTRVQLINGGEENRKKQCQRTVEKEDH